MFLIWFATPQEIVSRKGGYNSLRELAFVQMQVPDKSWCVKIKNTYSICVLFYSCPPYLRRRPCRRPPPAAAGLMACWLAELACWRAGLLAASWPAGWLAGAGWAGWLMAGCWLAGSAGWAGWAGWLAGWLLLAGWMAAGWLAGWLLAGWLAGWPASVLKTRHFVTYGATLAKSWGGPLLEGPQSLGPTRGEVKMRVWGAINQQYIFAEGSIEAVTL